MQYNADMNKARGSISYPLLMICFILVVLAQIAAFSCLEEQKKQQFFIHNYQLRLLCSSMFRQQSKYSWTEGEYLWFTGRLQPGNSEVKVIGESKYSKDNRFNSFSVSTISSDQPDTIHSRTQVTYTVDPRQKQVAGNCVLFANKITGAEYLPEDASIYMQAQSLEEVKPPQVDFLRDKSITSIDGVDIKKNGLSSQFYYCKKIGIQFPCNSLIKGSTLFSNTGSIDLESNSEFPDRIVLISSGGNIRIHDNVCLDNALIIAYGEVVIHPGCKIKGLVIAKNITLKGNAELIPDENVVAPFSSKVFT